MKNHFPRDAFVSSLSKGDYQHSSPAVLQWISLFRQKRIVETTIANEAHENEETKGKEEAREEGKHDERHEAKAAEES